jgi:ornithine carbamoyltransferase
MYNKDILNLTEMNKAEMLEVLHLAIDMKQNVAKYSEIMHGKTLAMIFEKSSTRTRISFETGMYQMGGHAVVMQGSTTQMGRGEPIPDTARVMSSMVDGIMIRTFSDAMVAQLAEYSRVPVVNGLTDDHHPSQILADFQTILEIKGTTEGLKIAYVGDGNNMAHSYLIGAAILGMDVSVASPAGYQPKPEFVALAKELATTSGAKIEVVEDPTVAVADADFIFTDVWASMGDEAEQDERVKVFGGTYQVNAELVAHAKADYHFMHCLPAHRGEEVSAEIIDGPHSVIFQEAENRMHAEKALLAKIMLPELQVGS